MKYLGARAAKALLAFAGDSDKMLVDLYMFANDGEWGTGKLRYTRLYLTDGAARDLEFILRQTLTWGDGRGRIFSDKDLRNFMDLSVPGLDRQGWTNERFKRVVANILGDHQ